MHSSTVFWDGTAGLTNTEVIGLVGHACGFIKGKLNVVVPTSMFHHKSWRYTGFYDDFIICLYWIMPPT